MVAGGVRHAAHAARTREAARLRLSRRTRLLGGREVMTIQYGRSFEDPLAYAHDKSGEHFPAWASFNRRIGKDGSVGIWHETNPYPAGQVRMRLRQHAARRACSRDEPCAGGRDASPPRRTASRVIQTSLSSRKRTACYPGPGSRVVWVPALAMLGRDDTEVFRRQFCRSTRSPAGGCRRRSGGPRLSRRRACRPAAHACSRDRLSSAGWVRQQAAGLRRFQHEGDLDIGAGEGDRRR